MIGTSTNGQVLRVESNGIVFDNTVGGADKQPELFFVGHGTSATISGDTSTGGLTVFDVKDLGNSFTPGYESNIFTMVGNTWLAAKGYALISLGSIETSGEIFAYAKGDKTSDQWAGTAETNAEKTLLVFQNQVGSNNYDISTVASDSRFDQIGGIYIDSRNLQFNPTGRVVSHGDIVVDLGNKPVLVHESWTTGNGSKSDPNTVYKVYINKLADSTGGQFGLVESAKINTQLLQLDGGVTVQALTTGGAIGNNVTEDSNYALTTGGTGFSIGTAEDPAYGLISVTGNYKLDGGKYYFQATGNGDENYDYSTTNDDVRMPTAGIKATGNIYGTAETIHLHTANIDAGGDIELSNTSLTLETTTGKVPANNGNSSFEPWVFNKYWTALKADGDIVIRDSTVTTGSATGFRSYEGSILLDANTTLNHTTTLDEVASGLFYAKNDIDVLGKDNVISGRFHAITTDGSIKVFGKNIDIRPDRQVDNMELLEAKKGDITLAAFNGSENDQETANLVINYRDHKVSNSNVLAGIGKTIRLHGDTGVKLVTASIFFGAKGNTTDDGFSAEEHSNDNVTITAQKGTIDLQSGANIRTSVSNDGGYGSINIYGQTVTADNTDDGKLTDGELTDVDVNMAGKLYANAINIGKGIGQSQVTVSGTINAIDNTVSDKGYSINLIAGSGSRSDANSELDDGLVLNGATVSYGDVDGGSTLLESKGGDIKLIGAKINDNGSTGVGTASDETNDQNQKAGTLTIQLAGNSSDREILFNKSQVNDDIIVIDAAGGTVSLDGSSSVVADGPTETETNNSLTVKGNSVSLAGGSHFGSEVDGTSTGAEVKIQTSDLALDNTSYITSEGAVSIEATRGSNELTISMDQGGNSDDEAPSWIKGESVSIGSTDQAGATSVTGGQITSTGTTGSSENPNIVIAGGEGENGGVVINDSVVSAGITGSVNIETGVGGKVQIGTEEDNDPVDKDTQILGNNITIGSADGTGNGVDINDAQIGFPKDPEGSSAIGGSISINGGSGAVDIVASEIGVENNDSAHGALTSGFENVTITGDSVSIGSADKGSGAGTEGGFDTAIGGSNIRIGDENTDSVKVGDAQIGTATEDDKAGSNVTINAGSDDSLGTITIGRANSDGESVINGGNVTIGAGSSNANIAINGNRPATGDNTGSSTGITGDKVVIGNGSGNVNVTGSDITSTGNDGITIEVSENGQLGLGDTLLDSTGGLAGEEGYGNGSATGDVTIIGGGSIAGSGIAAGGNVNFGDSTSEGNKNDHIVNVTGGSSISGNGMSVAGDTTVNLGGAEGTDKGNSVNIADEGEVTVEGELNIAGGNGIKGEGDLTINTGADGTVNVAENGTIASGTKPDGSTEGNPGDMTITGTGTVNVAGGKLEANSNGNSGGNIKVEGGDVNLSDNGSIEADGTVTIGGGQNDASVNVAAGETGTIVAGSQDDGKNNVVIGDNGTLNVGNDGVGANGETINEGSLLITNEKNPVNRPTPLPGGVMIDTDTNVAVGDGGHFASDNITFNEAEGEDNGKLEIGTGGSIYTDADTILENVKPEGDGNIVIVKPTEEGKPGATVQISGTVSDKDGEDGKSQLDKIQEAIGDDTTLILDKVDGINPGTVISKEDMLGNGEHQYGGAVIGDAVIDTSNKGGNSSANELTQGGGGSVMVDTENGEGTLTIRPDEDNPNKVVTITGSEDNVNKEIVVGAGDPVDEDGHPSVVEDGSFNIDLEDGADLTLGKDGAAGGTLSGSITATTNDPNKDQQSNVTVNGGNFTVEGSIDLTHPDDEGHNTSTEDDGDIIIRDHNTSNQQAQNGLTVKGDVAAGNLEMGGGDTNFDVGGNLDLSGDATLTGNADVDIVGTTNVGGDLDISGTSSVTTKNPGSETEDSHLTVGGDAHINGSGQPGANGEPNSSLDVAGDFDVEGELQIGTGIDADGKETDPGNTVVNVTGDITTGKDFTVGNAEGEGSAEVNAGKDVAVSGGNATIHGNGQVTAGGSFDVNGSGDNGNATIEGSLTANDADIDNNLMVGKEDGGSLEPNGSFVTDGSTNVGGNVVVNENGELSVGMNASGDDEGNLTVDGSLTTGAGSNVDVGGDLSVGESASIAGNVEVGGAADFDSGLTVGADPDSEGNVPNPNGSFASGGKTDVNGNLIVNGNSSVSVGLAPSGEDDDSLKVENGYADIDAGSTVTVGGAFEVTGTGGAGDEGEPTQGSAHVAGSVAADSANISQDLVVGNAFEDGKAPSNNGSFVTDNDAEVGGNVTVNDNGTLTVGTDKGEGPADLTIGGSLTTGAGSDSTVTGNLVVGNNGEADATIGGSLTVNGSGVEGTPSANFNGDLVVEAGGSFTNQGSHDGVTDTNVAGNATIGETGSDEKATADLGDAVIAGSTTVENADVTSGDFTGNGLRVSDDSSFAAEGGDIKLEGNDANLIVKDSSLTASASGEGDNAKGGNVTVGGYADLANGTTSIEGELQISGENLKDGEYGLVIGDAANGGEWEDGDPLQTDTTVTVGSINVDKGYTLINGDGKLEANGNATFGGGLQLGAGGAFVNNDAEADTTVKNEFILNAGASVDTKGEFTLAAGTKVGNTDGTGLDQGVLHGTITAGSIDFSEYTDEGTNNTITFAGGENASGDEGEPSRFEAGFETSNLIGNVALSDGANAVLTPGADGKAPVVNGWIDVNAGDDKDGTLGSTLTTSAGNKTDYSTSSDKNAVLNMDSPISFGENSGLLLGDTESEISDSPKSGVYLGANSSLVINAGNMASGSVLFDDGTDSGKGMTIHVENVTSDKPIEISMNGWTMGTSGSLVFNLDEGVNASEVIDFTSGSVLQNFQIVEENGRDVIKMEATNVSEVTGGTLTGDLADVVQNATNMGGNNYFHQAINQAFASPSAANPGQKIDLKTEDGQKALDAMVASGEISAETADAIKKAAANATEYSITRTDEGVHFVNADGKNNFAMSADGIKTVEEIATFPIAAGAFNATFDYLTEFNRAVETRALEDRPEGRSQSVWAHVIATFNKSDELFGGSGYSADLYGGVLGTDVAIGGNTLVGGALTVGTGDIESRGAKIGNKNDATFYGLSLYAQHDIGAMSVKGDLTYLRTENKISGMYKGVDMGGEFDSDAISVGVRAEFKAYESDTFEVKPHLGIRYTNYSFDNYEGTDIDDINTIESPVGVAFSGKVKAEGGWTVVPELDLSVVPQLGDRKATVVNAGTGVDQTILEGAIFNAKLGLGLTKDNFSFGLNYQHGAGGFGRNNNAFQAHARWLF